MEEAVEVNLVGGQMVVEEAVVVNRTKEKMVAEESNHVKEDVVVENSVQVASATQAPSLRSPCIHHLRHPFGPEQRRRAAYALLVLYTAGKSPSVTNCNILQILTECRTAEGAH